MRASASLVVIGAGIAGCSSAFHLARRGWDDIVVLDQGTLFETGGSTSHAPGLVFQTNASKTMTELAKRSVRLYSELESDGEPCFHPVGSLEVAGSPERWQDLKRKLGWAKSWGVEACLLSPEQAKVQIPLLDAARIHGAYFVPSDGIAKAVRAAGAMARAAEPSGATFHGQTTVTGIEVSENRIRAVVTSRGRIATERVLVCAGTWGPQLGRMAGVQIPLTPTQHQYIRTTPLTELAGETREVGHPILRHQDKRMYFRQHGQHYGIGSYQHEPLLVDPDDIRPLSQTSIMPSVMNFTAEHFSRPWADAGDLLPALRHVEVAEGFNGLFSFTPDGMPLLGEAVDVRGFWVAEAVWITHGGGVGEVVADMMSGNSPEIDLRECDLNRFDRHVMSRGYVQARGAQQYREVYDIIHPLQQMDHPRPLRVSPFYEREQALCAVCFEGRGWERPQWYAANEHLLEEYKIPVRSGWSGEYWSPIAGAEHLATRERVALFDMTPLPKLDVTGPNALQVLQRLTTNQLDRRPGSVTYTAMLDEGGGIKSDITVARIGQDQFQVGCNSPLDVEWIGRFLPSDGSAQVRDVTGGLCCVGLWGPHARAVVQRVSGDEFSNNAFRYFSARRVYIGEVPALALRVSYVGELGWEIYASAEYGRRLWDLLWEAGQEFGMIAGGRAAFESLRVEKGYRLWGNDMHTEHNPYEAGLEFAVKLDKGDFVGRDVLIRVKEQGVDRRLCCFVLDDPMVTVMGKEPILAGDRVLGYVTSASFGFSVSESIAYGYVPSEHAAEGTRVEIEYFGERHAATVVAEPRFDPTGARLRS